MLGYAVLLVLAAGMSLYAFVQLGRVTDVTHSILLVDTALVGLQKDLTDTLLSETRYEKKYLIVRDRSLYEGFLKSKGEFGHNLGKAMRLDISDEARDALRRIADQHLVYSSLFNEETEYVASGKALCEGVV